jgi:hypothetical protein
MMASEVVPAGWGGWLARQAELDKADEGASYHYDLTLMDGEVVRVSGVVRAGRLEYGGPGGRFKGADPDWRGVLGRRHYPWVKESAATEGG